MNFSDQASKSDVMERIHEFSKIKLPLESDFNVFFLSLQPVRFQAAVAVVGEEESKTAETVLFSVKILPVLFLTLF